MTAPLPPAGVVRYGHSSLAEVMPSALAALGVAGEAATLPIEATDCLVLLLIDGLGQNLLRKHVAAAPFLSSLSARTLTAGFPTTTAVSISGLGTGQPPGAHGLVGYTTRFGELTEPVNWLTWRGAYSGRDLSSDYPAEIVQPLSTAFERAERGGVNATVISAPQFRDSGLTRAALRGGQFVAAFTAADTAMLAAEMARTRRGLIYCYAADLDLIGHIHGCESPAWSAQLQLIDLGVRMLAERLPSGARLLVTADHGMVDVADRAKIDYDADPRLHLGVDLIAGEARVRYLYVQPGQLESVRRRWTDALGATAALLTREQAIGRGWFGPTVTAAARARIGDLIVIAAPDTAIVRRRAESRAANLIGHHGGLTEDELLVPLLSN